MDQGPSEEGGWNTDSLREYWNTHFVAEDGLASIGFTATIKPEFTCPIIDSHMLTNADLNAYTDIFVRTTRWLNFAENTLARIKSVFTSRKREMEQLKSHLKRSTVGMKNPISGKPYTVEDKELIVDNNPRYVELLREVTVLEEQKILMESKVSELAKDYALVSRQIELRKLDISGERIGGNIPHRGPGMYGSPR